MKEMFRNLIRDEQGQDLVEYSLLLGGVVLLALAGIDALGGALKGIFEKTSTEVSTRGS